MPKFISEISYYAQTQIQFISIHSNAIIWNYQLIFCNEFCLYVILMYPLLLDTLL